MNMARGHRQSTYVRLLKAGEQFYDLAHGGISTVAQDPVVDEDGMVTVLLAGRDRPSTFDWKDRVRLY